MVVEHLTHYPKDQDFESCRYLWEKKNGEKKPMEHVLGQFFLASEG
jgi:hypothetical protein